jgi:hypothetical protein
MQSSHRTEDTTCFTSASLDLRGLADDLAGRVAEHREARAVEIDAGQIRREGGARRLHQAAVVGAGDVERHDALQALVLRGRDERVDLGLLAGDDDLAGGVEIGGLDTELGAKLRDAWRAPRL